MVDSSGTERTVDTTAIIDPVLWLPFSIEKRHPTAVLPDSLGGSQPATNAVKRFYPFFADYLKEEIVIKKDPEGRPGKLTIMILPVKFQ